MADGAARRVATGTSPLAALPPAGRARLVRLYGRLTGDPAAAEDLAQDTLVEAWRHRDRPREVTVAGRAAIPHSLESVAGAARLEVVSAGDTDEVPAVEASGA